MFRRSIIAFSLVIVCLLLASCQSQGVAPSEVTFDISVIEIKGSTDGIAPPDVDPTTLSDGYRYSPPGEFDESNPEKWQVSTYLFSPSSLSAVQGDQITLKLFVVNGDTHTTRLEAPDGTTIEEFIMNRGREYNISFSASQAGYYRLVCTNHGPTMTAQILVLP